MLAKNGLFDPKAPLDRLYYYTLLCLAVDNGDFAVVSALFCAHPIYHLGVVNTSDCLHSATAGGSLRLHHMCLLAARGEYDKATIERNWEPGGEERYNAVLKLFFQWGANVSQAIDGDITALHVAAMRPGKMVAELLINARADISRRTITENSALMLASMTGNQEVHELLARKMKGH